MLKAPSGPNHEESVNAAFKKSSYCQDGGCVEVATSQDGNIVYVRDNKKLDQAPLKFTKSEWDAFVKGVKNNEFNID